MRVHPFRFLRGHQRDRLAQNLQPRNVAEGETVFLRGDEDDRVFLIARGEVEILDPRRGDDQLVTVVKPFHYFGEWEAIFCEPRLFGARARGEGLLFWIPGQRFRELLRESPACSQGFGTILRDNQGIFSGFDRFTGRLLKEADEGYINIEGLLPLYRSLHPAIHPRVTDPHRLDTAAFHYALRRLPENVTRTFAFLLVDEFPHAFDEPETLFPVIATAARRRDVWEMMPGKNMVLLRNGRSDLIDLVSCLCLYAVEAQKIRERLARDQAAPRLQRFLSSGEGGDEEDFLRTMPFSTREMAGIRSIWPADTPQRLYEILRHREMIGIDVRRQRRNYNMRRGEYWISQVARVTRELIGCDPTDLSSERGVHIVSSNTHSVTNCLNPWFPEHQSAILQWGRQEQHAALEGAWRHQADQVYALARDYFAVFPREAEIARKRALAGGQHWLDQTASTGIQVQVIDLEQLRGEAYDEDLLPVPGGCRDLVVNIDYAFGHQAEYVIRNLLTLFGANIRSISFLGKAGALAGERGDLLCPSAFIEQQTDQFQPLPGSQKELEAILAKTFAVHSGPMLTVEGTLLQNRQMLSFYREIWDVVGMEMEGTHYYREILESRELGVIPRDVRCSFLYYVSDIPLRAHGGLTAPLAPHEGVPPLYAITRTILNNILGGGAL
ncbi:Cyclic nucleotide-binding domain-containing protein [Alkalispirochaeta americana]|uniref:Cyclic nucleotide-binding domain-containing protein n=1 Tax=Alkalispirochaeta americana TaxID=159291 RepID=A0A1N6U0Q9_9SPIO|nr:Cyclic nucleotide-binding domain-containing protein [Alkalispirochaeta americana]